MVQTLKLVFSSHFYIVLSAVIFTLKISLGWIYSSVHEKLFSDKLGDMFKYKMSFLLEHDWRKKTKNAEKKTDLTKETLILKRDKSAKLQKKKEEKKIIPTEILNLNQPRFQYFFQIF